MATGAQTWSQTAANNATADTNINFAEGMAPSAMNDSCRAVMASVAKWRDDNNGTLITAGTSAAFTLATNQVEGALTSGYTVACQFHKPTEAGATLAVDGLAAKPLQIYPGTNLLGQEYQANAIGRFTYSTTGTGQWIANSPPVHSSINNVLSGDVTLSTAAYTDGPSVAQGSSGRWYVSGSVTFYSTTNSPFYQAKLWDGTSILASGGIQVPVGSPANPIGGTVALSGVINNPAGNLRISAFMAVGGVGKMVFNLTGAAADSSITAVRIG